METCGTCGAPRRYEGIMYPTRSLCPCEDRLCTCGKKAIVVEFQKPLTKNARQEPLLPAVSNDIAKLYCKAHVGGLDVAPEIEEPKKRTKRGKPHVDPVWERASTRPPTGSNSLDKVKCVSCGHVHTPKDRVMWNGSHSFCPKCDERMSVPEEDDDGGHGQDVRAAR